MHLTFFPLLKPFLVLAQNNILGKKHTLVLNIIKFILQFLKNRDVQQHINMDLLYQKDNLF